MKNMKNRLIVALVALTMVFTTACGARSFNATDYLTSFMDVLTKGEVTKYAELTGQTEEDVGKEYQEVLDGLREAFDVDGVSDETKDRLVDVYVQVLKKARYTVHEAEKTEDGYKVVVDIEPITGLYDNIIDDSEVDAAINSGEVTADNIYEWVYSTMADKMSERLDSLSYGEMQSVTVEIVKGAKGYEIKDQDSISEQIGMLLVDQSGVSED